MSSNGSSECCLLWKFGDHLHHSTFQKQKLMQSSSLQTHLSGDVFGISPRGNITATVYPFLTKETKSLREIRSLLLTIHERLCGSHNDRLSDLSCVCVNNPMCMVGMAWTSIIDTTQIPSVHASIDAYSDVQGCRLFLSECPPHGGVHISVRSFQRTVKYSRSIPRHEGGTT